MNKQTAQLAVCIILCSQLVIVKPASAWCGWDASQSTPKIILRKNRIKITNAMKCLVVQDSTNIDTSFKVEVDPPGDLELEPGSVVIETTPAENVKYNRNGELACDPDIEFNGKYEKDNEFTVYVTGRKSDVGKYGCFDIIATGFGRLDPRAKIVQKNVRLNEESDYAEEYSNVLNALELLQNTEFSSALEVRSIEETFESSYGVTFDEAAELAERYREDKFDSDSNSSEK